jgi:hypothetical protein
MFERSGHHPPRFVDEDPAFVGSNRPPPFATNQFWYGVSVAAKPLDLFSKTDHRLKFFRSNKEKTVLFVTRLLTLWVTIFTLAIDYRIVSMC